MNPKPPFVPWLVAIVSCVACSTESDDANSSAVGSTSSGGSSVPATGSGQATSGGQSTGNDSANSTSSSQQGAGGAAGESTSISSDGTSSDGAGGHADSAGGAGSSDDSGSGAGAGGTPAMPGGDGVGGANSTVTDDPTAADDTAADDTTDDGMTTDDTTTDDAAADDPDDSAADDSETDDATTDDSGTDDTTTDDVGDPQDELPDYVPAGYELAYDESFADPSSFDQLLIANEQEWFHSAEGFIEFTGASYEPPYRSPFSVALLQGISASSFVMEVEMLQTSVGEGHRDMVILWNVVSASEFYYAHVSAEHDDVAHNIHIVDFADRSAITDSFTDVFDWGNDVWRTLRVVRDATSGTMQVYDVDNGELILSATDTTFSTGFFGVGSFDNTGRVRNVKIWSPDATQAAIPFSF